MTSLPAVSFLLLRVEYENRIFHLTLLKSESPYKAIFQCLIVLRHVFMLIFHRLTACGCGLYGSVLVEMRFKGGK